jgi:RHS repeat-associated protein
MRGSWLLVVALLSWAGFARAGQFCAFDETYYSETGLKCFATYAEAEKFLYSLDKSPAIPDFQDVDPSRYEPSSVELAAGGNMGEYAKVTWYSARATSPPFDVGEQWQGGLACGAYIGNYSSEQAIVNELASESGYPLSEFIVDSSWPGDGIYSTTYVRNPTLNGRWRESVKTGLGGKSYFRGFACGNSFSVTGFHLYMCRDTDVPGQLNATRGQACKSQRRGRIYETAAVIESSQSCKVGNPCHPQTGVKTQTEFDFAWEGLRFERTYSSSHEVPASPGFGPGWTLWFEVSGTWVPDNSWLVRVGDKYDVYRYDAGSDSYSSVNVPGSRLKMATGHAMLELVDGRNFSLEGDSYALSKVVNMSERSNGLTYSFEYCQQGDLTCKEGALRSITSNRGRQINFVYADAPSGSLFTTRLVAIGDLVSTFVNYGYDSKGRLASATYPGSPSTTKAYFYNETGKVCVNASGSALNPCNVATSKALLTSIRDENGTDFASFKYDNFGRVVSSEHFGGADKVTLTYTSATSTSVTGANAAVTVYNSIINNKFFKLSGIVSGSQTTANTYDANGYLDLATDKLGIVTNFDFDAFGRLTRVVRAQGRPEQQTETTQWDTALNVPLQVDRAGQRINFAYNSRSQPLTQTVTDLTVTPSQTRTTTYTYCEQANIDVGMCPLLGLPTRVDGPRTDVADVETFTYYPADDGSCAASPGSCAYRKGDLWKTADAMGHVAEVLRYDSTGRAISIKDPNGVVTDLVLSPRGWLTASKVRGTDDSTEADDATTTIEYDGVGQVTKLTLPDGVFARFTYDLAHRLIEVRDALGNTITYTLDAAGHRKVEDTKDGAGVLKRTLSRVFNTLGQLQTFKDANLKATSFTYDAIGSIDMITDPLGRVADSNVDALGRLTQQIENVNNKAVDQATSKLQYDTRDNPIAVIDPKGLTTSYTYNGFDQVTRLVSPDTGITDNAYDQAGNLTARTDARGVTRVLTYDALNRLTSVSLPSPTQSLGFSYDTPTADCLPAESFGTGRISQFTDESGSTRFCYDRRGFLVRKVQGVAGGSTLTLSPTYNAAGRLIALTYPSGAIVTYLRDGNGQISRVDAIPSPGASQVPLVSAASYLPFGPLKSLTFGTSTRVLTKAYDKNYGVDIVSDSVTGGLSEDFTLDAVGNPTGLVERITSSSSVTRSFVYDGLDRMTTQKNGNSTVEAFKYDATGDRTSKSSSGVATAYSYSTVSHRLSSTGSISRAYDSAGNTSAIGSGVSAPNMTYDDNGRLRDYKVGSAIKASYRYNAKGERVWRIDPANGANNRQYFYDEAGRLLGEYDSTGARIQEYVWLDDTLVAVLSVHDGSAYQFVETDYLGSPRAVIHPTKNTIIWRWDVNNTAFGEHSPNADPDANALTYTLNLRFPGQMYDSASGLNYNYFRDYEPATGRYLESDPIGLSGGLSTYAYSGASPLASVDPQGLTYGDGVLQAEDIVFGPTFWLRGQSGLDASIDQETVDLTAGWGDMLSFGLTSVARDASGSADQVNSCSTAYKAGEVLGFANSIALGWAAGARSAVPGWANFSHSLVPARAVTGKNALPWLQNRFGKWLAGRASRNRLNGDYIPWELHAKIDQKAYRMLSAVNKALVGPPFGPLRQLLNRIPYLPGSALYGTGSAAFNGAMQGGCGCGD